MKAFIALVFLGAFLLAVWNSDSQIRDASLALMILCLSSKVEA